MRVTSKLFLVFKIIVGFLVIWYSLNSFGDFVVGRFNDQQNLANNFVETATMRDELFEKYSQNVYDAMRMTSDIPSDDQQNNEEGLKIILDDAKLSERKMKSYNI